MRTMTMSNSIRVKAGRMRCLIRLILSLRKGPPRYYDSPKSNTAEARVQGGAADLFSPA